MLQFNSESELDKHVYDAISTDSLHGANANTQMRRQLWCQQLPETIERQLNEDTAMKTNSMEEIRVWIINNEEFYGRTDDSFILRFLRVCKFDLNKTKQRIERFYRVRHNYSKYYIRSEEVEQMLEELIEAKLAFPMDYAGNSECNLLIGHIGGYDYKKYCPDLAFGHIVARSIEVLIEDPRVQVNGVQFIADMSGMSIGLITSISPALMWRVVNMMTMSTPMKIKGMHVINAHRFTNQLLYLLKFMLSKKLKDRLFIHKDLDSLHQHFSKECLPNELGGSAGPEEKYVDLALEVIRNSKEVNDKNKKYGVRKHLQQCDQESPHIE